MVARPSLKRVVPGSVPPWRALCAESARALKAFFSVLCVSKSVLLLEPKFGQILRALNLRVFWVRPSCPHAGRGRGGAPPQLVWPSGRASAGGPGLVSSCARVFFVAPSLFRAAATSTSGNLLSGRSFLRTETRSYSLPCNVFLAACQFVLFAARRFLQFVTCFVGRAAHALRSIC